MANPSTPERRSDQPHSAPNGGDDRITEEREIELLRVIRASRGPGGDARAGADAMEQLLTGYQDRLYAVCVRMVRDREWARDLTQDSLIRIMQGLDSYDGRARLSTWMIRVTMNVCLSHLRKQKLRRHASLDTPSGGGGSGGGGAGGGFRTGLSARVAQSTEPTAAERVELGEARTMVLAAMETLEPDHRAVLVLRDIRGLDYREIGDVLGVPIGTVKSRLFRARSALRDAMESASADTETGTAADEADAEGKG